MTYVHGPVSAAVRSMSGPCHHVSVTGLEHVPDTRETGG